MNRVSDVVKGYTQQNPFSDSQARNFSDTKICSEFCPISNYWSLFNDQHEILLGTRGSGKTFLLKMMRYSMLKRINDPQAQKLAQEKKYIALYVPMYLEFVTHLTHAGAPEQKQIDSFQFAFNCLLAQSLLVELKEIISEIDDKLEHAKANFNLTLALNNIWFDDDGKDVSDINSLSTKLKKLFYNYDVKTEEAGNIPPVFKRQISAPLLAVKELVASLLGLREEPTWIICVDEAEFLSISMQRCINSVFRSDSNRIALKVATLPYYHRTLQTLNPDITVSAGNDFCYRVVDMQHDHADFINLTNTLVTNRLKSRFNNTLEISSLEDFIGRVGEDKQIDYYREEVGAESASYEKIIDDIINEFSDKRKKNSCTYPNPRKTIYDKYAPVFFVRRMYQLSREGNRKPGWYAGSQMIRKISHGNPRIFIQIMSSLFEKARHSELTPKAQHGVLMEYVRGFCESTQALESNGPIMYHKLGLIAQNLQNHVHNQALVCAGCSFTITYDSEKSFVETQKWLQQAVAYSRIIVDEDTLKNNITPTTHFLLANTYAANYWLPMRSDVSPIKINLLNDGGLTYTVKMPRKSKPMGEQLSFFEEEDE